MSEHRYEYVYVQSLWNQHFCVVEMDWQAPLTLSIFEIEIGSFSIQIIALLISERPFCVSLVRVIWDSSTMISIFRILKNFHVHVI